MRATPRGLAAGVLLLSAATHGSLHAAAGDPIGGPVQLNTYTTGRQSNPEVASLGPNGFVVVWPSVGSGGTDDDSDSVQARLFDPAGAPLGGELQVNTFTTSAQENPVVAATGPGGFVVVWQSYGSSGSDLGSDSIQGQRFDATGTPVGTEFQVNSYTTGDQSEPHVASDGAGGFVVVWESYGSGAADDSYGSIQGRRFDAAGQPQGDDFQVNTYTSGRQSVPAVGPLGPGGFIVLWESEGGTGTDTSGRSIEARRFDAAGMPLEDQFQVNTHTPSVQGIPGIGPDGSGGFVALWDSSSSDSDSEVRARHLNAAGSPVGDDFQVNTLTTGYQVGYSVGPDGSGGFVVVWSSEVSAGTDTDDDSIQARRYDAAGNPRGDEFQVNAYTTGGQTWARVSPDGAGGFVVVWRSMGSGGTDKSGFSIQAQRFEGGLATTTTTTTLAPRGEGIEGRTLKLTAKPGRPEKSKLSLVAKDRALTFGQGNDSVDDPVVHGGELRIASSTGAFDVMHALTGSWRYAGRAGQNRGYKWKSRTAPIRSVIITRSGKLAIQGEGAALGTDLDDDPNPVRLELSLGAYTYCLEFGGDDGRFKAGRLFRAKRAAAPATCP